MIELRPYQSECIEAIETAEKTGTHRQLVALPTGTGKTVIFSTAAKRRNGRTLILAHRDELIQQAVDKLTMVWEDANVGVVKAERNEVDKQVIVGSVQTVCRENRLEQLPTDFDFVVSDEAHHAAASTYQRIYKYLGVMAEEGEELRTDTLHLGVTATPQRTDKIGLADIFDRITFHRSICDFIPDYLCDLRCVQIMTYINIDGVETWAGDLRTEQLSALLNTANCNELIVAAWKEHAIKRGSATALSPGRLTLGFTTDAYAMSNLAWVQLNNGFRLNLGKDGAINVYTDFKTPTLYRVFYRNRAEKRQITRHPVELSWAFGLAESEARRVTAGNLVLVDRSARWRQYPASDKQIAKLAEFGVYRTDLTKGEASDLLARILAEQYSK